MNGERRRQARRFVEGDMGIGTLILFIAMVLVAAIAAAVIIQTAGVLQQQGQETGTQATEDVSGGLEILSVIGDRYTDGAGSSQDTIQTVELRVALTSGSPDIDFDELVILISDGTAAYDLTLNASGTTAAHADDSYYVATAVRDSDSSWSSDNVITRGDIIKILICADSATSLNLDNNVDVWVRLMPEAGEPTYESFTTPNTYIDRYIELV